MINYQNILNKNLINVFKDILFQIKKNNLPNSFELYITFISNHKKNLIPNWLLDKYPNQMTIVLQYEYSNLKIKKDAFSINLSFNNINTQLDIHFDSIISFADPSSNFGLKLREYDSEKNADKNIKNKKLNQKGNIINFSKFKKN